MGFRSRFLLGFVTGVLLCGEIGWGQAYETTRITVLVNDSARVKPSLLKHAETEAGRLFRDAGIEIEWVNCRETGDCRRALREDEYVLSIVPHAKTRTDTVFGTAFLGPDGRGKYADVFFNRVQELGDINIGQLLGAVAAHELGHLLLGSGAHSLMGIMEPVWRKGSLERIGMGGLTFTPEQRRVMNGRLAGERNAVTSLRKLVP